MNTIKLKKKHKMNIVVNNSESNINSNGIRPKKYYKLDTSLTGLKISKLLSDVYIANNDEIKDYQNEYIDLARIINHV